MISYLLLVLGVAPFIILFWFYVKFIQPKQDSILTTLKRLNLPNKVGTISLAIAIVAFIYSIFYSSVSTYYSLKAIESADISGAEQREAFKKQIDIMQRQQLTLEKNQESMNESVKLAQLQVENLTRNAEALNQVAKTTAGQLATSEGQLAISEGQLALLNEQREDKFYESQLRPDLKISFTVEGNKKSLSEEEIRKTPPVIKLGSNNTFDVAIYIANKGSVVARNVTIMCKSFPKNVDLSEREGRYAGMFSNRIYTDSFANYALSATRVIVYPIRVKVPDSTNSISLLCRVSCDHPGSTRQANVEFLLDRSVATQ